MGRRFKNRFGEVDNVRKFVQRNGNLAAESDGTQYTYDAFNRLVETDKPDGTDKPGGTWQKNIYDAVGLRMATAENGTYTEYTFDRGSIVADYNKDENRTTRYIRGYDLISQEDGKETVSYYLHNAHGDITKLADSTGNIQNSYSYNAFGSTTAYTEKVENRFRYAGEQYDAVTGQIYLRARYYEPEVGRFLTEDTFRGLIDNPQSLNLYTYCANNPVKYIDPSGHRYDDDNYSTKCENDKGTGNSEANNGYYISEASENLVEISEPRYIDPNVGFLLGIAQSLGLFSDEVNKYIQLIIDYNIENIYQFEEKYKMGKASGFLLPIYAGAVYSEVAAYSELAAYSEGSSKTVYDNIDDGLNFSKKALEHMDEAGRSVPTQTLQDAIKYGEALPDPRGSSATMYYTTMTKNGKMYNLEVLYDSTTNTVYHFEYARKAMGNLPAIQK